MPLVLPKRCPRCAVRVKQKENGYWECLTCGWTDDPELVIVPMPEPAPLSVPNPTPETE